MLTKHYPRIIAVIAVTVFFTSLDVYVFSTELVSVAPLYWIIAFGLIAAPLYLSRDALLLMRQAPIARWCYGFFMVSCTWFLFQPMQSEVAWQELRRRSLAMAFMLIVLAVFSNLEAQVWARRAIFAAVLLGVGLNVFELFNPQTFSSVIGRAAGLYINPNESGVALVLGMILTLGLLPQRYRLLFAFAVGAGVALTFSRSAMVGWIISIIVILKIGQINLRRSFVTGFVVVAISLIAAVAQWDKIQYQLEDLGVLNSNVMGRVGWLNQPIASDESALGRQQVAEIALEKFSDSPVLGQGVGASQKLLMVEGGVEISSHNQYLNLMVDHGILGFFILPLLTLAVTWRARGEIKQTGIAFAAFIFYIGFFSHNILEDRFILLAFSLMAAMIFKSRQQQHPLARPAGLRYAKHIVTAQTSRIADNRSAI